MIKEFPAVEFGAHLHTTPQSWEEKVSSAVKSGCRRFDGAMLGKGGCPMAKDDLTGNMPTENIITYLKASGLDLSLNEQALSNSIELAKQIF